MEKGRKLLFWAGILFVFAATSVICIEAQGLDAQAKAMSDARVDAVTIDVMAKYGKLELPGVTFYHDLHTDTLSKMGKDCAACHEKDANGKLSIKFKRLEDKDAATVKGIYHDKCIGCHQEMVDAGQKSGALDGQCRSCHTAKPAKSDWQPIAMDKSLHFRHVEATGGKEKCQTCHHKFDKEKMELVEDKGKEQNCRNCHGTTPRVESDKLTVRSFENAAHTKCVSCHQEFAVAKKATGPAKCSGCHSAVDQAKIKKFAETPRLMRGQPDAMLLVAMKDDKPQANIGPVPFDHKAHEGYANDCRSCHVGKGTMDGKFMELAGDMHAPTNMQGCIGCHQTKQAEKPECASCHSLMPEKRAASQASCTKCHVDSLKSLYMDGKIPEKEVAAAEAAAVLSTRNMDVKTIAQKDIPEEVIIGSLSDKFQASKLPHRKIVNRLIKEMQGNNMAGYFHGQETLMCQGCHHNSPASVTPPKCGSCHTKPFQAAKPDVPGLKAAYHGQCMGCHAAMKLEKPVSTTCDDAEGCHKKK